MNYIEIHFSIDGFIACTIKEWEEFLDMYNLDDAHDLFYTVLHQITRDCLDDYWKQRMLGYKNN